VQLPFSETSRVESYTTFGKYCSCYLQGKYVLICLFFSWKTCVGQAVGGEWDVTNLIDGEEELTADQVVTRTWPKEKRDEKFFTVHGVRRRGFERFMATM
jgi:hypothetical protein